MRPWLDLAKVLTARRGLLSLVVATAVLGSGCAMKAYQGPVLPKSEIAVLHKKVWRGKSLGLMFIVPYPIFKHRTNIYEIDGKRGLGSPIHILPGRHSAKVRYRKSPEVAFCGFYFPIAGCIGSYTLRDFSIVFMAEAGHEYRIPAERRDKRDWVWVEDITTGKVVAGEQPPAIPPATQSSRL